MTTFPSIPRMLLTFINVLAEWRSGADAATFARNLKSNVSKLYYWIQWIPQTNAMSSLNYFVVVLYVLIYRNVVSFCIALLCIMTSHLILILIYLFCLQREFFVFLSLNMTDFFREIPKRWQRLLTIPSSSVRSPSPHK